MTPTSRSPIVVGLDGSPGADAALAWAVEAARRRKATLWLVHAKDLVRFGDRWLALLPPVETQPMTWSVLTASLVELEDVDVADEPYLDLGPPVDVLLERARDAQMVVVGSRGHGGFVSLLLGSTSLQVAMRAPCPVVVVREPVVGGELGPSAGRVVIGVDGSAMSDAAIRFGFEEADSRGIGLTAVHAWQSPEITPDAAPSDVWRAAEEHERAVLAERLAGWVEKYPDVAVTQRTVHADAAAALVNESAGAALTVVGSRGDGGFTGLLLGSVSHAVLHYAGSPVAVARTDGERR